MYRHYERRVFKTMRFQKSLLLKPFLKVFVFLSVFSRCCVGDTHKIIKLFQAKVHSIDGVVNQTFYKHLDVFM